ncbi:MAG TPA: acyl-CoA dehydrogenase family protein [Planctomycetota bacterium]|nr:acyl-CoA dehydrogenase family protein [Planctomycetota bacterium]
MTPTNVAWKEKAREVAEKYVRPVAAKYDRLQEYPWEVKDKIAEAGLMGVWIPKEYGGAGGGVLDLCIVVEELSRACGGMGVMYAVNALGSFPIILGGTEAQKRKYLPEIAAGRKLIAFGLSERNAGSDAASLQARADVREDGIVLNGSKKWTTNGGVADMFSVFAVSDPESKSRRISAVILERGDPGFEIGRTEDKMGIRCVPVVELNFRDAKVPVDRLLGGERGYGFKHAMMTLDCARPGVAAQAVGLAQGALEYATVYVTSRQQFGVQISSFQMIQQMLADMATRVEAARQLVHAAARAIDAKASNAGKMAAMAKLFATDTAMEVTTNAVQLFGGYGYMHDYPVEKYMRDAKITQIYEGTNQVQRLVIARAIIKESMGLDHLKGYIPLPDHPNTKADRAHAGA